jgi:hypothetical protein
MAEYVRKLTERDPYDVMARSISNYFYRFLLRHGKLGLVGIKLYDLREFRPVFAESGPDLSDTLDEVE